MCSSDLELAFIEKEVPIAKNKYVLKKESISTINYPARTGGADGDSRGEHVLLARADQTVGTGIIGLLSAARVGASHLESEGIGVMNVFSLDRRIKFFFLRHRSCGLKLPNGWFGRPYENRLSLVKAEAHDDALIIELDHPLHLIFHGIPTLESKTDGLHLTDFNALVFEWKEAGETQHPHRKKSE